MVVYSSDLSSANNSKMVNLINSCGETSSNLINEINAFINDTQTTLTGGGYEGVRAKLALYVDVISKQKAIGTNLVANIQAANNTMLNFMEGYSMLDDSKIPEIETKIREIETMIAWLKTYSEETGTTNGTASEIAGWEGLLKELNKLLEKLKALASTDAYAYALMSSVEGDIISFGTALGNVKLPNYDGTFSNLCSHNLKSKIDDLIEINKTPTTTSSSSTKTGSSTGNRIISYSQKGYYDKNGRWRQWGYKNNGWGKKIYESGCGPTSLASCLATMFQDSRITPSVIASLMTSSGQNNGFGFAKICNRFGLNYGLKDGLGSKDSKGNLKINNFLKNGGTIVLSVRDGGHYISILGMTSDGKYIVNDSYFGSNPGKPKKMSMANIRAQHTGQVCWIAPRGMTVRQAQTKR